MTRKNNKKKKGATAKPFGARQGHLAVLQNSRERPTHTKPRRRNRKGGKKAGGKKSMMGGGLIMPQHTQDYMDAIIGGARSSDACGMPDGGGFDSVKCKTTAKGVMGTATNGAGWIIVEPAYLMCNSVSGIFFTLPGCTDVTPNWYGDNPATSVVGSQIGSALMANATYANATFGFGPTGIRGRIVAVEISVLYIGTELNCGGVAFVLCDPQHQTQVPATLQQAAGFSYISSNVASGEQAIEMGKPICCKYNGVTIPGDLQFSNPAGATTVLPCMVIGLIAAGGAQNFEWQVDVIYELVGSVVASATPSPEDPKGRHAVDSAMQRSQAKHPDAHGSADFVAHAATGVGKVLSEGTHVVSEIASHLPGEEALSLGAKFLSAL